MAMEMIWTWIEGHNVILRAGKSTQKRKEKRISVKQAER